MYNYLATLRTPQSDAPQLAPLKQQRRKSVPSLPVPLENFSAQRATWLFVCQPEKLDQIQQEELMLIRQASPSAETAYGLAQAFMQMIREHTGQQLDTWVSSVEASHLYFARKVCRIESKIGKWQSYDSILLLEIQSASWPPTAPRSTS